MNKRWWLDGSKDVTIILLLVLTAWALISRAAEPNVVAAEQVKTRAVEVRASALQTQVVALQARPTPTPRPFC